MGYLCRFLVFSFDGPHNNATWSAFLLAIPYNLTFRTSTQPRPTTTSPFYLIRPPYLHPTTPFVSKSLPLHSHILLLSILRTRYPQHIVTPIFPIPPIAMYQPLFPRIFFGCAPPPLLVGRVKINKDRKGGGIPNKNLAQTTGGFPINEFLSAGELNVHV